MLYKPNYCCNCGEKIERVQWSFTTSRRFCDVCQTDFPVQDWLTTIFAGLMSVIGLFGFGALLKAENKPPGNLNKQLLAGNSNPNKTSGNRQNAASANINANLPAKTANTPVNAQTEQPRPNLITKPPNPVAPTANAEAAYFCGASTKKGTPCSRRVKGGGRCWQHQGQPAVLPPEKLLVSQ